MNRAEHRDWIRQNLGIVTPIQRWEELQNVSGLSQQEATDLMGGVPVPGQQPTWSPWPNNDQINRSITNACRTVNRQVNLSGTTERNISIEAQTADGPLEINLGTLGGYDERSILDVRRIWWFDGSTHYYLKQREVGDMDRRGGTYLDDAPGYPIQCWVDGYVLSIDPAPSSAGTITLVVGDGLLAPKTDVEQFDPIPDSYDPCILWQAVLELAATLPNDAEMRERAKMYAPVAAQGILDLQTWFNCRNLEEMNPTLIFDGRQLRRWGRRR